MSDRWHGQEAEGPRAACLASPTDDRRIAGAMPEAPAGAARGALGAGLLASALWALPQTALAAQAADDGIIAAPTTQFLLGCACGAAATAAVAAGMHAAQRGRKAEDSISAGFAAAGAPASAVLDAEETEATQAGIRAPKEQAPRPAAHMRKAAAPAASAEPAQGAPKDRQADASAAASPEATADLTAFARSYVKQAENEKRKTTRSRGVRAVLADRFGKNMFDDLPVIQRADGSVGDVGTEWWNETLGGAVRRVGEAPGSTAPRPAQPAASAPAATGSPAAAPSQAPADSDADRLSVPAWASKQPKVDPAEARRRAIYIARNVAEVDEGVYPARRSADELDKGDMWEQALDAMDRRLVQDAADGGAAGGDPIFQPQAPKKAFSDEVGGADSIDDPEGLEPQTSFIPFRVPADHPEVVDTDTYVDYLIDQEFSRNRSQAARASSRNYLKVIDGGSSASLKSTNPLRPRRRQGQGTHARRMGRNYSEPYHPKHLAPSVEVREA